MRWETILELSQLIGKLNNYLTSVEGNKMLDGAGIVCSTEHRDHRITRFLTSAIPTVHMRSLKSTIRSH